MLARATDALDNKITYFYNENTGMLCCRHGGLIKWGLEKIMFGMQLSERQDTNAKSVKLLSFKTKAHVVFALLFVIMVFSGCGSADYFLEIGNDYAICRTSPENRVLGYEPSEDRDFWSTRIEKYYISHYFVAGDYIGLCGYYDPSWDAFYVDEMGLHTLPSEDIPDSPKDKRYYLLNVKNDSLSGPYSEETFLEHCKSIGVFLQDDICWLDPDEVAKKEGLT